MCHRRSLCIIHLTPLGVAQPSRSVFLVSSYHDHIILFEYMTVVLTHSWMRRIRPIFFFYENNALQLLTIKFYKKAINMYTDMLWTSYFRTLFISFSSWPHICEHHCIFLRSSRALGSWGNFPNPFTAFVLLPQASGKSCAFVHFRWRHLPRLPALIFQCPCIPSACNCGCQRVLIQFFLNLLNKKRTRQPGVR